MSCVRLAGYMEIEIAVLGKLFEEKDKQGVNILTGCHCIRNRFIAITISDIDRLIEEYNGCVVSPRKVITDWFGASFIDTGRTKLHKQTRERRAAGTCDRTFSMYNNPVLGSIYLH